MKARRKRTVPGPGSRLKKAPEIPLPIPGTYFDGPGSEKSFTHPLDAPRLSQRISPNARILDFGCGYGRICRKMKALRFQTVVGVDISLGMLFRGKKEDTDLNLCRVQGERLPFQDSAFDLVFLFAVLTCIPGDSDQEAVISEISRVLSPGGHLFVSDYLLQRDRRNRKRYQHFERRFETYGVFETSDGAIFRHHDRERFMSLLDGFLILEAWELEIPTMNGNPATIVQIIAQKTV